MLNRSFLLVCFSLILLICGSFVVHVKASDENSAASVINNAEASVASAYEAVLNTEKAGANVTGLLVRLDDAGKVLASARMSFRNGDFDTTSMLASLSGNIAGVVQNDAVTLKALALREGSQRRLFTVVGSIVGIAAIALGSVGIWHFMKKRLKDYRGLFVVASLGLILLAAVPVSAMYIHLPSGSEKFSELWLLGPSRRAEGYPFDVKVNETHSVCVGVGNHLGYSAYYRIYVKFRNETQPLPMASNSTPSPVRELYEFGFFARDNMVWETPLNFTVLDVERSNDSVLLNKVLINDVTFNVACVSVWNSARKGFYDQLFFELWLYNMTARSFQYHDRFVGIWLNMTN